MDTNKRVVVTGMGTVNPIGNNIEEFLQGMEGSRNGISSQGIEGEEWTVGKVDLTNEELMEKLENNKNFKRVGGRGAVETIASILSINKRFVPKTINTQNPEFDIRLTTTPIVTDLYYHLKANAGFGGHNEALIIGKYQG